jgi:hypothetical protein
MLIARRMGSAMRNSGCVHYFSKDHNRLAAYSKDIVTADLPFAGSIVSTGNMIYVVWGESLRKRGNRREPKWLGEIDAEGLDEARRIAAERWPGIKLNISEQQIDVPTTPKDGWGRDRRL